MKKSELFIEQVGNFALLPVVHYSYEFAIAAQVAFQQLEPCGVGVEYPFLLQDLIVKAIGRLPKISVLLYGEKTKNYVRIEPVDPFVEVARRAIEAGIELRCVDLVADYPQVYDPMPDTYSLYYIGHKKYCEMLLERPSWVRLKEDIEREAAMAYHLHELERKLSWSGRLKSGKPILVLCGLAHLRGLKEQLLLENQKKPEETRPSARLYNLSPTSLGEIMGSFPFLTSVYELQRRGIADEREVSSTDNQEDAFDKLGSGTIAATKQAFKVIEGHKPDTVQQLAVRAHKDIASTALDGDRNEILTRYMLWCRAYYEQEIGDRLNPQQLFLLKNFARKYAHTKGMLLPDFYETLVAGRGCINSHFCYRMWEMGTYYEPQKSISELETIELRAEDISPFIHKVRMNPNAPLKPRMPRFLSRKDKQRKKQEFEREIDPHSICSYQPEDLTIESYGRYLRTKGKGM
ncbi:MAG: hypothetical protein JNN15_12045, partial [Blastocatellia bacterium]|nr:hypothetical protein [Blastocatellia bacterium]